MAGGIQILAGSRTATMRTNLMLGALVATAVVGACGAPEPMNASAPTGAEDPTSVTIEHIAFTPARLEVAAGTTVTWTNRDANVAHTITSGRPGNKGVPGVDEGRPDRPDGLFDGAVETDGSSFEFTFDESGTYPYFCKVHPVMTGSVVVR